MIAAALPDDMRGQSCCGAGAFEITGHPGSYRHVPGIVPAPALTRRAPAFLAIPRVEP